MNTIDLFSGAGGLSLGLKAAGAKLVARDSGRTGSSV